MTPTKKRAPRKPRRTCYYVDSLYVHVDVNDSKLWVFSDNWFSLEIAKRLHKWLGQYIAWAEWKERK